MITPTPGTPSAGPSLKPPLAGGREGVAAWSSENKWDQDHQVRCYQLGLFHGPFYPSKTTILLGSVQCSGPSGLPSSVWVPSPEGPKAKVIILLG